MRTLFYLLKTTNMLRIILWLIGIGSAIAIAFLISDTIKKKKEEAKKLLDTAGVKPSTDIRPGTTSTVSTNTTPPGSSGSSTAPGSSSSVVSRFSNP